MSKEELTLEEVWFRYGHKKENYDWVNDDLAAIAELVEDAEDNTDLAEILKKGEIYK